MRFQRDCAVAAVVTWHWAKLSYFSFFMNCVAILRTNMLPRACLSLRRSHPFKVSFNSCLLLAAVVFTVQSSLTSILKYFYCFYLHRTRLLGLSQRHRDSPGRHQPSFANTRTDDSHSTSSCRAFLPLWMLQRRILNSSSLVIPRTLCAASAARSSPFDLGSAREVLFSHCVLWFS